MASNLRVMLDQALGSGDDAGAVNFLELKVILDAILAKLDIGAQMPQVGPNGEVQPATDKYHERLQQLERIVEGITRPKSPNTLIQQTQNGDEGPITKDFAENRLKKRVDANEEGIEKALDMLEKLARQLKNVESDFKDTKDRMASEQKTQDDHLSALDSAMKELESKMEENKAATDKVHDLSERLASLEDRTAKVEQLSKEAVNWSQLDESFSHDFFGNNLDKEMSKCHEEREKYQNYFDGLHKLADMRDMIEDINSGLAELDKHVQTNINDMTKRQVSRSTLGDSRHTLSRDNLHNSSHSLTGRSQPPSQSNPHQTGISSNSKSNSRTQLGSSPAGGGNTTSSSSKQDGNNALSKQINNNAQKDSPLSGSSSSSSRRVSDHKIGKTALESAANNNETLNAPNESSAHSNSAAPQELNQSSSPQDQNVAISDSQNHQNRAESLESKNQSHHSLSKHAKIRPGKGDSRTDHTTEETFSSEDNSGWSNSNSSSGQAQKRVRKSVVARNSIRQSLGNFRQLINLQGKPNGIPGQISPKTSESRIGDVDRRAEEIDGRVNDLLDENNRLRRDLEMFKTSTEKVGDDPNKAIIMKLHDEISNVADSLLELRKRLRDEELKTEDHGMHLREHEETLDIHGNDLADLKNLRSELDNMSHLYESKFKEMAATRAALGDGVGKGNSEISNETVEKLQKQLSGTERELKAMEELLKSLSADGKAKSKELEHLQRLLHDLQERAALKDFVTTSLDQKADASDLRALLSKDELDSTAQSIINQLQELINRQAAHEQSMGEHLKEVGQEVDHRTKDDDFNRFSEEIEKRLRALRKKIEKAGAGELRDLATEAGAAGFRKQLFNCISCDKDLYMRITNPLLPSPSAFPARMSLRPHTAYDTKHVRAQARGDPSDLLDPIKRENTSDYNTLLVEKELERRRKMKENKIRQEISGYNFKSGSIPRQVGGNRQVIYDRGARQEELRQAMGTEYETADLEGVDGHLYKGRVRKLPNLVRKTLDEEDLNRSLDSPAPADVHTPPTAPEKS